MQRFALCLGLATACGANVRTASLSSPPQSPAVSKHPAENPSKSRCELTAVLSETVEDGELKFVLELRNVGDRPVRLVMPGDGSDVGRRTPTITWIATQNGEPGVEEDLVRCGNMDPFEESQLFSLRPGETRLIEEWVGKPEVVPGEYQVRVRYHNDPTLTNARSDLDPVSVELAQAFADTDDCEVTSNEITTVVKRDD